MEEEESSGSNALIPLAVAIIAVLLGGAGLYFGYSAQQRTQQLQSSLTEGSSGIVELERALRSVEAQLAELGERSGTAGSDLDAVRTRLRVLSTQIQEALGNVSREVNTNREAIARVSNNLNELAESMTTRPAATRPATPSEPTTTGSTPSAGAGIGGETAGPGGTYTIESGDTFQRIATSLGISLQSLLDANPDVDPRRLRIGQQINLP